ncbi:MAG TPA: hypothetical protein PLW93_04710, partial [Candidatus Absconditabacterales bacterium]|nr:hypothetical protein [Candidatus Absconditabacterales bacterium]
IGSCDKNTQQCNSSCTCEIKSPPQPVCGNNKKEGTEQCDGTDIGSCDKNTQQCNSSCTCETLSSCTIECNGGIVTFSRGSKKNKPENDPIVGDCGLYAGEPGSNGGPKGINGKSNKLIYGIRDRIDSQLLKWSHTPGIGTYYFTCLFPDGKRCTTSTVTLTRGANNKLSCQKNSLEGEGENSSSSQGGSSHIQNTQNTVQSVGINAYIPGYNYTTPGPITINNIPFITRGNESSTVVTVFTNTPNVYIPTVSILNNTATITTTSNTITNTDPSTQLLSNNKSIKCSDYKRDLNNDKVLDNTDYESAHSLIGGFIATLKKLNTNYIYLDFNKNNILDLSDVTTYTIMIDECSR